MAAQHIRVSTPPGHQFLPQLGNRLCLGLPRLLPHAQGFSNRGKVTQLNVHANHSDQGMKSTTSPARITVPAGLSITPSAHTADVSTPEL